MNECMHAERLDVLWGASDDVVTCDVVSTILPCCVTKNKEVARVARDRWVIIISLHWLPMYPWAGKQNRSWLRGNKGGFDKSEDPTPAGLPATTTASPRESHAHVNALKPRRLACRLSPATKSLVPSLQQWRRGVRPRGLHPQHLHLPCKQREPRNREAPGNGKLVGDEHGEGEGVVRGGQTTWNGWKLPSWIIPNWNATLGQWCMVGEAGGQINSLDKKPSNKTDKMRHRSCLSNWNSHFTLFEFRATQVLHHLSHLASP
jgi:hypothetical protein